MSRRAHRPTDLEWLASLPVDWEVTEVGRDVWVRARLGWKGLTADEYVDDGVPMLATPDIKDPEIRYARANKITHERYEESPEIMLQDGDVLLTKDGSTIGTVNVVRELPGPATVNGSIAVMTPTGAIDGRYLFWFIASSYAQSIFGRLRGGMGVPHLFQRDINRIRTPRPPLPEQCAIADYLDHETASIDTLIEEQKRLIEMLRERRTAVIAHATSQGTDIEFRRVIAALRQGWSPNCESGPADGVTDWGVLKVGCANTGRFDSAENKRLPDDETPRPEFAVRRNELVMSRSNTKELVGAAAVVDGDYPRLLLSDLTYGISLTSDADPAFVAYALGNPSMRAQISTASKGMSHSMQKISQRDIRELRVRLPALAEQQRIAANLTEQTAKIDTLITETERFIELARERRSALIAAAVTGQVDVREMV